MSVLVNIQKTDKLGSLLVGEFELARVPCVGERVSTPDGFIWYVKSVTFQAGVELTRPQAILMVIKG